MQTLRTSIAASVLLFFATNLLAEAKLQVGVIAPMTGELATWGKGITNAVDLAAKDFNFDVSYEDEESCDAQKALLAAQRLVKVKKVSVLISGCLNGIYATKPIVEQNGILQLAAGLAEGLKEDGRIVSLSWQITDEAEFLTKYFSAHDIKSLHLVRTDDNFAEAFAKIFKSQTALQVVGDEPVPFGYNSFASLLLRIRAKKPDAIFFSLGDSQTTSFLTSRMQYRDTTPLFGNYVIESNPLPGDKMPLLNGVVYSYPKLGNTSAFTARYAGTFRNLQPTVNSFLIYDGLKAIHEAEPSCSRENVSNCLLASLKNPAVVRTGLGGSFSYGKDGSVKREFEMKTVRDGAFTELP